MSIKKLNNIYKKLPRVKCKGLCTESCGPINFFEIERINIERTHGAKGIPQAKRDLSCNQLTNSGRCKIYNERPLICRLFGVAKGLKCQHGCVPDKYLPDRKAQKFMEAIEDLTPKLSKHIKVE